MVAPGQREVWLDWLRGLCVLFMVEVHLLDAWLARGLEHGLAFHTLRYLGGFAAPGFLFLAGLGLAKKDASLAARGASIAQRRLEGLRRGAYVLGIAYTFRVVEYVFGRGFLSPDGWVALFRVDILNIIGVASMLVACTSVQRTRARAVVATLVALIAVVVAHPLLAGHEQDLAGGYLYARNGFALVNWSGFALAGALFAQLFARDTKSLHVAAAGVAILVGGVACEMLPPIFAVQDFWRSSPEWFLQRLGLLVFASGVLRGVGALLSHIGWVALLGRHSLMAYMVSVDLTYGQISKPLHKSLPLTGVLVGACLMTAGVALIAWLMEWRSARAALAPKA